MDTRLDHREWTRTTVLTPGQDDLRGRLIAARTYALSGARIMAREIGTATIQTELPVFATDRSLLPLLVQVLLLTGSFEQIGRVLRAVDGRHVTLLGTTPDPESVREILFHHDGAQLTVMFDKTALQRPGSDQLAAIWAERIVQASHDPQYLRGL
jgi:hypothetical protein